MTGTSDHIHATRAYGPDPAQVYDVLLPPGGRPAVTVVAVHGGFWRERHDRSNIMPLAQAMTADGFAVAVLEYRRVGMPGGGWPGSCDDVRVALDAVAADPLLPEPLVAVGHSAGGHLVTWLASGQPGPGVQALVGVVSVGGCVDLRLGARLRLGDGATQDFLGGEPEQVPDRYAAADPALLVPPVLPVHLVHGTADDVVPPEVSESYVSAAEAAASKGTTKAPAAQVTLTAIPGADHFTPTEPGEDAFAVVLDAVRAMAGTAAGREPEPAPGGASEPAP